MIVQIIGENNKNFYFLNCKNMKFFLILPLIFLLLILISLVLSKPEQMSENSAQLPEQKISSIKRSRKTRRRNRKRKREKCEKKIVDVVQEQSDELYAKFEPTGQRMFGIVNNIQPPLRSEIIMRNQRFE